jgi:hypothetical protein
MYGLVNKAIEDLVTEKFGAQKWEEICAKANFTESGFISMKSYPDALTYNLVGAASQVLGSDANELLEAFGEYWILYTGRKGYGELLDLAGNSLPEFLKNLDVLHMRVSHLMPNLQPPSFSTRNETESSIEVLYRSHRAGMLPMLFGLIKGLGKKFELECKVTLLSEEKNEFFEAVMLVEW